MADLSAERWRRLDALLASALERRPEERESFAERACGDDRELLEELRALLAAGAEAEAELGESAAALLGPFPDDAFAGSSSPDRMGSGGSLRPGTLVGPYRIGREIGRGGMATVYTAERADSAFEKRVAVKVVKRGMDTEEVLERFRSERQILASLDHPDISRLLDGGATPDGRPFLVMEHVEGVPIDAYCETAGLDVPGRIRLFTRVCRAVDFAHRNLVVHRDLKPSNILVTRDGSPTLLDFGIAKVLDGPGPADHTRTGLRRMTPSHAAPEQIRGDPVTTAIDVYGLGAVLYQLLAGRRPYDLTGLGPAAVEQLITGSDPVPPSRVVGEDVGTSGLRRGAPASLSRALRGDLDTIVLKAMAREPGRRYASALELAQDLERHLAGLPVRARPASRRYRAAKFVRRHRSGVAAAAVLALALAVSAGALALAHDRTTVALGQAERAHASAEAVATFLEGLFAAADPTAPGAERLDTLSVAALLERGAARVPAEFENEPELQTRMLRTVARAQRGIGNYDGAEALLSRAMEVAEGGGVSDAEMAELLLERGSLHLTRSEPAEAERVIRESLALQREMGDDRRLSVTLSNLGSALQDQGAYDEAAPLYDSALSILRSRTPPDSSSIVDVMNARMALAFRTDDLARAEELAREVLAFTRARLGDGHPNVARDLHNLGFMLQGLGRHEEAEPYFRESIAVNREALGPSHPHVLFGMTSLAVTLVQLHREDEARALYDEAIPRLREVLGARDPSLAVSLTEFAELLADAGDAERAERLYLEALSIERAAFGEDHVRVGIVRSRLAGFLCSAGDQERAERHFGAALAVLEAALPPDHQRVVQARASRDECLGAGRGGG